MSRANSGCFRSGLPYNRFGGFLEWRALLTGRPLPEWMFEER